MRTEVIKKQDGIVLVFVLWVVVLLSIIAGTFILESNVEAKITANMTDSLKAQMLAEKGVYASVLNLIESLNTGAVKHSISKKSEDDKGNKVSYSAVLESGKIDINYANKDLLKGLFLYLSVSENRVDSIVDSILDWRDQDSLSRLNGAEDRDYETKNYNYGSKDHRFDTIEELKLVMGVTNDIYTMVESFITVNGFSAKLNPLYASEKILRAVPYFTDEEISQLIAVRESDINKAKQLLVYSSSASFFSFDVNNIYRVKAQGELSGGARSCIDAVVLVTKRLESPFKIFKWRIGC